MTQVVVYADKSSYIDQFWANDSNCRICRQKLLYLSILSKWLSNCRICQQLLYLSVYYLYWYKYKHLHGILACNWNATSRFGDLLLIIEIVKNKNISCENFLKVTSRFWYWADDIIDQQMKYFAYYLCFFNLLLTFNE